MLSLRDHLTYRAQHWSFLLNATVIQETARILTRTPRPEIPRDTVQLLRRRTYELWERDLENVKTGMYPRDLLFQIPMREYARVFPRLFLDTPNIVRRMRKRNYKDIPEVDKTRYPA